MKKNKIIICAIIFVISIINVNVYAIDGNYLQGNNTEIENEINTNEENTEEFENDNNTNLDESTVYEDEKNTEDTSSKNDVEHSLKYVDEQANSEKTEDESSSYDNYTAPSLLPEGKDVDTQELSSDDWKYIINNIKKDSSKGNDFSFIKDDNNKKNDSWMLIVGVSMIVLSIVGFTYLIIMKRNDKVAKSKCGINKKSTTKSKGKGLADTQQLNKKDWNDFFNN